ncbi:hypothetical protein AVEN_267797-1 [Araneus ventricosus]|uniref:Mos1 transposase HTH domain-containing protein n=1 Tax=Araneus ventricosus TaxID=182803 RepID=A0A4Y2D4I9_ARAVE|nr:hypothetical protein AVEN_267797-1 [Araneus ventricosus]
MSNLTRARSTYTTDLWWNQASSREPEVPADCKVRFVIRFLNANVKQTEIHRQLVEIYGENVMTDGMVRKWIRQFNDGRTNVHDEARSGRPSVVSDGLVAKVNEKIR